MGVIGVLSTLTSDTTAEWYYISKQRLLYKDTHSTTQVLRTGEYFTTTSSQGRRLVK